MTSTDREAAAIFQLALSKYMRESWEATKREQVAIVRHIWGPVTDRLRPPRPEPHPDGNRHQRRKAAAQARRDHGR